MTVSGLLITGTLIPRVLQGCLTKSRLFCLGGESVKDGGYTTGSTYTENNAKNVTRLMQLQR